MDCVREKMGEVSWVQCSEESKVQGLSSGVGALEYDYVEYDRWGEKKVKYIS